MKLAIFFHVIVLFVVNGNGDENYATTWNYLYFKDIYGTCSFDEIGYKAGGKEINITKTVPPTVSLEKMALSEIAGRGEQATTIVFEGINTAKEWKKLRSFGTKAIKTVGKWARRLAGSLGLIGGIFAIASSELELSPEDVAERTNEAFRQMAQEIDNKMQQMKGYVDQKIIEMQRRLLQSDLNVLQNLYTECIVEKDLQNMIVCLKEAAKHIRIFAAKFMDNEPYIREKVQLTPFQVKEAELKLLVFKDYANLCINVMSTLAGIIDDKINDDGDMTFYSDIRNILKKHITLIERFSTYADWHVEQFINVHAHSPSCDKTLECNRAPDENHWKSIVTVCTCLMDPTLDGSDTCKIKLYSRESNNGYEYRHPPPTVSYPYDYAKEILVTNEYSRVRQYKDSVIPVIRKYWKDQLLGYKEVWDEALEVAKEKLNDLEKMKKKEKKKEKKEKKKVKKDKNSGNKQMSMV